MYNSKKIFQKGMIARKLSPKDTMYVPKARFLQHFQKSRNSESLRTASDHNS